MPQAAVDGKYYQVATPRSMAERLTVMARDRIYADFLRLCQPSPNDTILDVGVSDVINDACNVVERKYPHAERITAAGLGDGEEFRRAFPRTAYRRIEANWPLPFPDKSFDIAVSNAVLEHVGSVEHQALFVSELVRVAHRVFITVPNRYFPVEHHTAIPLLHFWKRTFELACKWLGKSEWADERNLILMLQRRLAALVPSGVASEIGTTGIPLGLFSSNLYLFVGGSTGRPNGAPPSSTVSA